MPNILKLIGTNLRVPCDTSSMEIFDILDHFTQRCHPSFRPVDMFSIPVKLKKVLQKNILNTIKNQFS